MFWQKSQLGLFVSRKFLYGNAYTDQVDIFRLRHQHSDHQAPLYKQWWTPARSLLFSQIVCAKHLSPMSWATISIIIWRSSRGNKFKVNLLEENSASVFCLRTTPVCQRSQWPSNFLSRRVLLYYPYATMPKQQWGAVYTLLFLQNIMLTCHGPLWSYHMEVLSRQKFKLRFWQKISLKFWILSNPIW